MQNNILFDNIYIGHSVEDAESFRKETWDAKIIGEREEESASVPKFDEATGEEIIDFKKDPVKFVKQKVQTFIEAAKKDPVEAVKAQPEVAGPIGLALLTVIALIFTALSPAAPTKETIKKNASKAKAAVEKAKDDAAEAIATGTEKAKDATKRATRSSEKS
jgi:calnexin